MGTDQRKLTDTATRGFFQRLRTRVAFSSIVRPLAAASFVRFMGVPLYNVQPTVGWRGRLVPCSSAVVSGAGLRRRRNAQVVRKSGCCHTVDSTQHNTILIFIGPSTFRLLARLRVVIEPAPKRRSCSLRHPLHFGTNCTLVVHCCCLVAT
jgi:hypothetical protein